MKSMNVIERFTVSLNPELIGKPMLAFMFVILEHFTYMDELMKVVTADKDMLECYAIAGEFDYILKIRARDMSDLENKIVKVKAIKGVRKTNTIISLLTHKYRLTALPD
jgi:DNA-binding Lrp family transcriptional regulator